MELQWSKLLCQDTLAEKEKVPNSWVDYPMDPFEQDYREVIHSVSFRRLQDKAQIYQFGKGDFVRTRLTHSLEVSTIAKQLGIMLVFNDKWNHIPPFRNIPIEYARALPTVLECAGLLHDMGNPPYGHEGEYAIGSWFRQNLERNDFCFRGKPIREVLGPHMCSDLTHYEGNAQVIRMLAKCRFPSENQEANVSLATISTLLKYPVSSVEMNRDDPDLRIHKFGYYYSEREIVKKVREGTGMVIPGEPHARNPLTYLLEAADDIAYVVSDLEDATARQTISIHGLIGFMKKEIERLPEEGDEEHQLQRLTVEGILNNLEMRLSKCGGTEADITGVFHKWTNYLRNWLMYVTASSFVKNWKEIMDGTYRGDLLESSMHKYTVQILKSEMYHNVYPRLGDIHAAAYSILGDLVDKFAGAVIYWDTDVGVREAEKLAFIDLLPDSLKSAYLMEKGTDEAENLYLRFRMVTDYISSMTDAYALELYKKINGYAY